MGQRSNPAFGPFFGVKGADLTGPTVQITSPIHNVISSATITTMTPPLPGNKLGFIGPVYLVASTVFSWGGTGNIATTNATVLQQNFAYPFIYDDTVGKWYPIGARDK